MDDLNEEDVRYILDDDTYGFVNSYLTESDKYTEKVQKAVEAYKNAQKFTQLRAHWTELTGTDSPYGWSNKYSMPILALVPSDEMITARKAFGIINSKTKDEDSIAMAEDYISKMSYVSKLNNKDDRDKAFKDSFLANYSVLFEDVDKLKAKLRSNISENPYYWLGSKEVTALIKEMADVCYKESGFEEVKKAIDEMTADQVKEYLIELIKDNTLVGVEIMKGNK